MRRLLIALVIISIVAIAVVAWSSSRSPLDPPEAPTATTAAAGAAPTLRVPQSTATLGAAPSSSSLALGKRTKTSGCVAVQMLPDAACTPGAVLTTDAATVCTPGYSSKVRHVSGSTKNAVYAEYGIKTHTSGQYEVDHHISLELGGSNDIANLWPEPAEPAPGFHEKDKVENYLHQQVCDGAMSLEEAQYEIATDWYAVYLLILP